jgi:hypothetical protein
MHYFVAHDRDPLEFGLLPAGIEKLPARSRFEQVATPPLRALRNLTQQMADSVPLVRPRPLAVELTALGEQKKIFDGNQDHPPLWHRDVVAVLPFQLRPDKFAVAMYVMTYDATQPTAPEEYRIKLRGIHGTRATVSLYDPHEDRTISVSPDARKTDTIEVVVPLVDHPRLLMIAE